RMYSFGDSMPCRTQPGTEGSPSVRLRPYPRASRPTAIKPCSTTGASFQAVPPIEPYPCPYTHCGRMDPPSLGRARGPEILRPPRDVAVHSKVAIPGGADSTSTGV